MTNSVTTSAQHQPFSEQLKAHSRTTHDSLDHLVMSMQPFGSVDRYGKFLQAQHEFHEVLRPVYADSYLNEKITDLATLTRAERVKADMVALGVKPMTTAIARPTLTGAAQLGWLYCAEGSNVGAAILYKEAGKIKLDEGHGAWHLAAHPMGRMPHWRAFKQQLDNVGETLSAAQKHQTLLGADEAFAYFKHIIRQAYAVS